MGAGLIEMVPLCILVGKNRKDGLLVRRLALFSQATAAQSALQRVSQALGYSPSLHIARVHPHPHPACYKLLKRAPGHPPDALSHEPMPVRALAQPVANRKAGQLPVRVKQAHIAQELATASVEDSERQPLMQELAGLVADDMLPYISKRDGPE